MRKQSGGGAKHWSGAIRMSNPGGNKAHRTWDPSGHQAVPAGLPVRSQVRAALAVESISPPKQCRHPTFEPGEGCHWPERTFGRPLPNNQLTSSLQWKTLASLFKFWLPPSYYFTGLNGKGN